MPSSVNISGETNANQVTTIVDDRIADAGLVRTDIDQSYDSSQQLQGRENLGLGNVNNTSDANKPVSTAAQAQFNTSVKTDISQSFTAPQKALARTNINSAIKTLVNIREWGAVLDGTTDDTLAVIAAIKAAIANGYGLTIDGYALMTDSIESVHTDTSKSVGAGGLSIIGTGIGVSGFKWSAGATRTGISLTIGGAGGSSKTICFDSLDLLTGKLASGKALKITGDAAYAADRTTPRALVRNLRVMGSSGAAGAFTDGWLNGVHFDNCTRALLDQYHFRGVVAGGGEPSYLSEAGITYNNAVAASPHPTEFLMCGLNMSYAKDAIIANDFEGGIIKDYQFVGVNRGISASGVDPSAVRRNYPHLSIGSGHINASQYDIRVDDMAQVDIDGATIYKQLDNTAPGTGIILANGVTQFTIRGVQFENLNTVAVSTAIDVQSASHGIIDNCVIRRTNPSGGSSGGTAIKLGASASNVKITESNVITESDTQDQAVDADLTWFTAGTACVGRSASIAKYVLNQGSSNTIGTKTQDGFQLQSVGSTGWVWVGPQGTRYQIINAGAPITSFDYTPAKVADGDYFTLSFAVAASGVNVIAPSGLTFYKTPPTSFTAGQGVTWIRQGAVMYQT